MALTQATVGGKITAAIVNAIINLLELVPYTIALKPVTPTSVSGTGVSVGSHGAITFSASSSIVVEGCFTSTYSKYRIEIDVPTTSTNNALSFNFRLAGADVSTANYDRQTTSGSNVTTTTAQSLAQTSWSIVAATSALHLTTIELTRPAAASPTLGTVATFSTLNAMTAAATTAVGMSGILHRLSTAYDGFKITTSAGTATGTIRIYGYNTN